MEASSGVTQLPPSQLLRRRAITMLLYAIGGMAWGACLSISPDMVMVLQVLAGVFWVPGLVWICKRRTGNSRHIPGGVLLVALAVVMLALAEAAPLKYEDRNTVGPLSGKQLTLGALAKEVKASRVSVRLDEGMEGVVISLPSTQPTLRQLIDGIEARTPLKYVPRKCATGATFLWGLHPIGEIEIR